MLIPSDEDLKGVAGSGWDQTFELWADDAETVPFPWTGGWSVARLEIDRVAVLTPGDGLTVAAGVVTAHLSSDQTTGMTNASGYRLVLNDPNGDDQFPIRGLIFWTKP